MFKNNNFNAVDNNNLIENYYRVIEYNEFNKVNQINQAEKYLLLGQQTGKYYAESALLIATNYLKNCKYEIAFLYIVISIANNSNYIQSYLLMLSCLIQLKYDKKEICKIVDVICILFSSDENIKLLYSFIQKNNKYLEYFDANLNFDFNINNYKNNTIKEKSKKISNISISNQQVKTVDILIPIFNQTDLTLNCIHSVINSLPFNKINCQVYLLDDASNDISLINELNNIANKYQNIFYIRRNKNIGFIANMNLGMQINEDTNHDVIWLNSDTFVNGNWIDRLRKNIYTNKKFASATPLTNNGELMSFPNIKESAPVPSSKQSEELDNIVNDLNLSSEIIEIGCGFCFYIKREALNDIGYLDETYLKRGYGEETDWCMRAKNHGWLHIGVFDTFVAHLGENSFSSNEKTYLAAYNNAIIHQRYKNLAKNYNDFVENDSLKEKRKIIINKLNSLNVSSAHIWLNKSNKFLKQKHTRNIFDDYDCNCVSFNDEILNYTFIAIADDLNNSNNGYVLFKKWLNIAHYFANRKTNNLSAPILLLGQSTPYEVELLATKQVVKINELVENIKFFSSKDIFDILGNFPKCSLLNRNE